MAKQNVDKSFLNGMIEVSPGVFQKMPTKVQPRDKALGKTLDQILKEQNINVLIHKGNTDIIPSKKVSTPSGSPIISFNVNPIGACRMTRRDAIFIDPNHADPKKRQRPAVTKYWIYKRQLQSIASGSNFVMPESHLHIYCYLEMPQSWSRSKKEEMNGKPHKAKPDADNILKGIQDSLCSNDAYIHDVRITKVWAHEGSIDIYITQ